MAPQKGDYYYHFKHDPSQGINDHTYVIIGTGKHTETEGIMVAYKPLYQNDWLDGADFFVRPLDMFTDSVDKDGIKIPRFSKITDRHIIDQLQKKQ